MRRYASISIAGLALVVGVGCGDNVGSAADGSVSGSDGSPTADASSSDSDGGQADSGLQPGDPTLLITEVALSNNAREFIEIFNPTDQTISLRNYYLCDDSEYSLLPGAFGAGPAPVINIEADAAMQFDFLVKFPDDASIAPGQVVVVAMRYDDFNAVFTSREADYGILQAPAGRAMIDPGGGAFLGIGANAQFAPTNGEMVALFHWDGSSDLVQDVDLVNVGMGLPSFNRISAKTGITVDGPDADTTQTGYGDDLGTLGEMDGLAPSGQSHKRLALEAGFETQDGTGNGLTGHDETSESLASTWDGAATFSNADPGTVPAALTQ